MGFAGKVKDWRFYEAPCYRPFGSQGKYIVEGTIGSTDDPSFLKMEISKVGGGQKLVVYYYHNSRTNSPIYSTSGAATYCISVAEWEGFDSRFGKIYDLAQQRYEEREVRKEQNKKTEEKTRKAEILQKVRKLYFT